MVKWKSNISILLNNCGMLKKESGKKKHLRKRLTAAMSALAVSLTMCGSLPIGSLLPDAGMITASAAVKTQCETYSGGNVNGQSYSRWTNPIDSYLTVLEGGGFMRFQNGAVDGNIVMTRDDINSLAHSKWNCK